MWFFKFLGKVMNQDEECGVTVGIWMCWADSKSSPCRNRKVLIFFFIELTVSAQ